MTVVAVEKFATFETAFGETGLRVGPRSGPGKRTNAEKEWYVLRRFLREAMSVNLFNCPLVIRAGMPPDEPDFTLEHRNSTSLIEITEATDEADQKEMTALGKSGRGAIFIGEFGGRFKGGAGGKAPEEAWANDVLLAIKRKDRKAIFTRPETDRHLVIYPNSNAASLLMSRSDEEDASIILKQKISNIREDLTSIVKGCRIHILGKEFLFFDILGTFQDIDRQFPARTSVEL
jgi:hypothetical protein